MLLVILWTNCASGLWIFSRSCIFCFSWEEKTVRFNWILFLAGLKWTEYLLSIFKL
ncbi:hypothetical protein OVS_00930 [Mycoplasma ovis str. Michigan]|uniref:Uncharacterized protein n=1 Tax=Mycoplasma ovis str. Michigan TaxID=1415773 RepID=A0ABM5P1A3_9MOLU|nr:hypothetical protein OVS_00930 [Mycoplasma ovis str. Michigan]